MTKFTLYRDNRQAWESMPKVDSITFGWNESGGFLVDATGLNGKTIVALDNCNTDALLELFKVAKFEQYKQEMNRALAGVKVPTELTQEQVYAVVRKYQQNPDGSPTLQHFFSRVSAYGDYAGLGWCGMFLGIEKNGYTHS